MRKTKFLNSKKDDHPNKLVCYIRGFIFKCLVCCVMVIGLLIAIKKDPTIKEKLNNKVFKSNFSFASINKWYKDRFGEIFPFDKITIDDEVEVFNEKFHYKEASLYKDGVKLTVSSNYLVPIRKSGIIVFIGEKDNYGNTVIVQQVDGVDVWYSNINVYTENVKLYNYVEEGSLLGEAKGDYVYLVFQKEGKFLDYKEYI